MLGLRLKPVHLLLANPLLLGLAACIETSASSEAYQDYEIEEIVILSGRCAEGCTSEHYSVEAYSPSTGDYIEAINLTVEPRSNSGFDYCITFFDEQTCGTSNLSWNDAIGLHVRLPCRTHGEGLLMERLRSTYIDGSSVSLPSIWFTWEDGSVTISQGGPVEEVTEIFGCSSEE